MCLCVFLCVCVQGSHIRRNNLEQYTFSIQAEHFLLQDLQKNPTIPKPKIQILQTMEPGGRRFWIFLVFSRFFGGIFGKITKKHVLFLDFTVRGVENPKKHKGFLVCFWILSENPKSCVFFWFLRPGAPEIKKSEGAFGF